MILLWALLIVQSGFTSDEWYTVTLNPSVRYGYYHDHVEIQGDRIIFQNHYWKHEEGFLNEEHLGGFSKNDPDLTPLFFNFQSKYRATEIKIDGTVKDGKWLTVKIHKTGQELPIITRTIPKKIILSIFFPVWLGKTLPSMKPGQTISFTTLLEDNLEASFNPVSGRVRLEKPDDYARKTSSQKLNVNYRDQQSIWYVDKKGIPLKMDLLSSKARVDRVSKETAERFLQE